MRDYIDINMLTIEQYLIHDNIRPGIVKPEIVDDVEFKINSNFMRELRRKLFKGNDDEDADEHVRRKVQIFYTGLDIPTRIKLDSKGFIPLMTLAQALKSIQVMVDHSHNWYDGATTKESINDSSDNVDTNKLKENIHDIQKDNPYKTRKIVYMIGILEKVHKKKAQEDKGDMDDGWDITIEDVERLRKILTPTIHTLPNLEPVGQPYMPRGPIYDEVLTEGNGIQGRKQAFEQETRDLDVEIK
nr:hypothetical protein [Tanacetum cinerariifolium]